MDLSETYRRIAQQYFPNALIVADRFHVVRLANQHLMAYWKQIDPEGGKNREWMEACRVVSDSAEVPVEGRTQNCMLRHGLVARYFGQKVDFPPETRKIGHIHS